MKPTGQLKWMNGLKSGFRRLDAKQRGQYSWVAKTESGYVFTAEIDHIDKHNNRYRHTEGRFDKYVPPLSKELGNAALSISHAQELYDAAQDAHSNRLDCHVLLVKGTKFGTNSGGVKTAADSGNWIVTSLNGSVSEGFALTIERSNTGGI